MVPPSHPSKIHPGSLSSSEICPHPISLPLLPPIRPFLFSRPSTSSSAVVTHCPSVGSQTSDRLPANALLLVPCSSSRRMKACPPTCAAGSTWFRCGWRGVEDGYPLDCLESLDTLTGVACLRRIIIIDACGPLSNRGARICLSPPPLSTYNRTCPNTLPPNRRAFSWSPCTPSPRRSPWTRPSCRPPERLPVLVTCPPYNDTRRSSDLCSVR